jgi:hypothetical protein
MIVSFVRDGMSLANGIPELGQSGFAWPPWQRLAKIPISYDSSREFRFAPDAMALQRFPKPI